MSSGASLALALLAPCALLSCGGGKAAVPTEVEIAWPDAGTGGAPSTRYQGPSAQPDEPDAMPAGAVPGP